MVQQTYEIFRPEWDKLSELIKWRCPSKMHNMKDYYQILGLDRGATPDQIKAAYRKLAVELHPDRNSDPRATERFKEVNEANEVLSDPQKRAEYDHGGMQGQMGGGGGHQQWHFHTSMGGGGFDSIFENIFRGGFPGFGFANQPQRNPDTQLQLSITLEEAYCGKTIPVQFQDSAGQAVNLQVTIPAGVENNTRLRYAGNGTRVHPNLAPGDLYVIIQITPHARYQRDGAHLLYDLELPLWQCLTGTTTRVPLLEGGAVDVVVPPLAQPGQTLRVKGKGMPTRQDRKIRGDLHVRIGVNWPTHLTPEQQAQLKSWAS